MSLQPYWEDRLRKAVIHFWTTRESQSERQGSESGERDAGSRAAVTGGKQMDGFVELVADFLEETGIGRPNIYCDRAIELPGWFRAEKKWDLLVVSGKTLIAAIEFKSHVGSFGNNFNNRTEEALGSATDLWAAYREGAFAPSQRPWLGYLMLLEDSAKSSAQVRVKEPHFQVFPEFRGASYALRYEILVTKLLRERLYDGAALLMSSQTARLNGDYREPSTELSFENLLASLKAQAIAIGRVAS